MRNVTKEEIIEGIEAYRKQQNKIIELIKTHGNALTQDEFDAEFSDFYDEVLSTGETVRRFKKPIFIVWPTTPKSFLLGSLTQGDWAKWLHLTQLMVGAKILTANKNMQDRIVYTLL